MLFMTQATLFNDIHGIQSGMRDLEIREKWDHRCGPSGRLKGVVQLTTQSSANTPGLSAPSPAVSQSSQLAWLYLELGGRF